MSLLSNDDARMFLERLGVGDIDPSKLSLQNLSRLVCAFQETIPFQSVSMMSTEAEERHVPRLEEVVASGLALEGGVCFDLNIFMCILLRALGYQADVLDGSYSPAPARHTHVVILVHNIRYSGDRHIVDVGTGFPFLEPVPVDELPVTHCWAGQEVKYIQEGDIVYRYHKSGDHTLIDNEKHIMRGEWHQKFDFPLEPVDYDFFRPHMESIYVQEKDNGFLNSISACRFPRVSECVESCLADSNSNTKNEELMNDSHNLLAIKDNKLYRGPMNNLKKEYISMEELAAQLKHNFPNLQPSKISAAINSYINVFKR